MMNYEEKCHLTEKKYRTLTKALIAENMTISAMESMTGGLIASLLTDTQGASAVMPGSFVTYSNAAKICQGVPKSVIETYGVYSIETARAMATACKEAYNTCIGIGVTGSAGNADPNNADSVPGCIYFAVAFQNQMHDGYLELPPLLCRKACKLSVAEAVADRVLEFIEEAAKS